MVWIALDAGFELGRHRGHDALPHAGGTWVGLAIEADAVVGDRQHEIVALGMEGDVVVLQDIYTFDFSAGIDEEGRFRGGLRSSGIRPSFSEKLNDYGIALEPSLFSNAQPAPNPLGRR